MVKLSEFSRIRVAVVGAAHWHAAVDARYLELLRDLETQIVGVADPDPAAAEPRARAACATFHIDFREMLEATRPDFVIALGRHCDMPGIAGHLLDSGYPFMMEKPMGLSADQVRPVVEKAEKKSAFVAVPYVNRLSAFAARAFELVEGGTLGTFSHAQFRIIRPSPARYRELGSSWMLDPALSGGGCLRNLGGHGMDLFRRLAGPQVSVISAAMSSAVHGLAVEDYAQVVLKGGDVIGTVEAGYTFPVDGTDGEWRIAGSRAHLVWKGGVLTETRAGQTPTVKQLDAGSAYRDGLVQILRAWMRGEPPLATARDCLLAAELIDRAYAIAADAGAESR